MEIIERLAGRYKAQDASYGTSYGREPGWLRVECGFGARSVLTRAATVCGCGTDYKVIVRDELIPDRLGAEASNPRSCVEYRDEETRIPYLQGYPI